MKDKMPAGRAALIVGHPGHELRIHGWMELAQPTVYVLTDGSGGGDRERIASTSRLLQNADCTPGDIYGVSTDKRFYQAMMQQRLVDFVSLTNRLADSLEQNEINYVVGDSFEGYNPTHDLCRLMIGAAVEIVANRTGHLIENYDFLLSGAPDDFSRSTQEKSVLLRLDDQLFERKISAARSYTELAHEVDAVDKAFGLEAFRAECFSKVDSKNGYTADFDEAPFYERYGEQQVAAGLYQDVLRFGEHFHPLANELWSQAVNAAGRVAKAS